jgi:hypothetical protein
MLIATDAIGAAKRVAPIKRIDDIAFQTDVLSLHAAGYAGTGNQKKSCSPEKAYATQKPRTVLRKSR